MTLRHSKLSRSNSKDKFGNKVNTYLKYRNQLETIVEESMPGEATAYKLPNAHKIDNLAPLRTLLNNLHATVPVSLSHSGTLIPPSHVQPYLTSPGLSWPYADIPNINAIIPYCPFGTQGRGVCGPMSYGAFATWNELEMLEHVRDAHGVDVGVLEGVVGMWRCEVCGFDSRIPTVVGRHVEGHASRCCQFEPDFGCL